jgi:hypothetical protein
MTLRRPDIEGVTDVGELARKVQRFAEDVIGAIEQPRGGFDSQLIEPRVWAEDGGSQRVLTAVRSPRVIVARAVENRDTTAVVATGSVSFNIKGRVGDETDVEITDISGLSSGTTYQVALFVVGEV